MCEEFCSSATRSSSTPPALSPSSRPPQCPASGRFLIFQPFLPVLAHDPCLFCDYPGDHLSPLHRVGSPFNFHILPVTSRPLFVSALVVRFFVVHVRTIG